MKLKFMTQDFQTDAVNAVADLFAGKGINTPPFSVMSEGPTTSKNELGFGNTLFVSASDLLVNMNRIQKRNRLPKSKDLYPFAHIKEGDRQFTIEMETGTGKTYVYTKTIFELNKRYGLTKFIIVVPSVPIREGVYKSLQITSDHFAAHYDNVPCRFFLYNSSKLSDVRQFSISSSIEIMIINIDSFKKAQNVINQQQDRLNGETAMRHIRDTNLVVIIDEPQSVDNTELAKLAIEGLNPLFVLRYSATHKEKRNMLYRLNPVDAYEMGLVKQIVVVTNASEGDFNKPYIALKSVTQEGGFKAKIEMDVQTKGGEVTRKTVTVKPGSDLYALSGARALYEGYKLTGIDTAPGREYIEFANTVTLKLGKAYGGIDENILKRAQIFRTIECHLEKELDLTEKGIKVLSLFFIDEVAKFRKKVDSDQCTDGTKGVYAIMFEECYVELINRSKFDLIRKFWHQTDNKLSTGNLSLATIFDGYFSQDKKGVLKNTRGDTLSDDDTYNTIMRDKEWLLSFECPLRFIFSHSALKEGWDNPNVFQVCTLIEQKSLFTRRQKIGRGLRLCVDQDGNRIEDREVNSLHVMANESFAEFAVSLQKEIEAETGVKFGVLLIESLIGQTYEEEVKTTKITYGKTYTETRVHEKEISYEEAESVMNELREKNYITKDGSITQAMQKELETGKLLLETATSEAMQKVIIQTAQQANKKLIVREHSKEVSVRPRKQAFLSQEFNEIWDMIKQKTTFRINIDTEKLIKNCVDELRAMPPLPKANLVTQTADIKLQDSGVTLDMRGMRTMDIESAYSVLPDIVRAITTETLLKRSTVIRILCESKRHDDFLINPQVFTQKALEIIARNRHDLAIDGISYIKLDGQEYWVQEIFDLKKTNNGDLDFEKSKIIANIDRNAISVKNALYDHIVYESGVESRFAASLDNDPDVKLFFKIPSRFKIETPIGTYNPDFAVYLEKDGDKKLYFVFETKGTADKHGLSNPERQKIICGKTHFDALENDIKFVSEPVVEWREFRKTL